MIGRDYIDWLFERYGTVGHLELFKELSEINYSWQFILDENRAQAGLALRDQCAYETGVYLSDVADGPCSCLEMICALGSSMYDMSGFRDPRYFVRILLSNLHLDSFKDPLSEKDRKEIRDKVEAWLSRSYDKNGHGSIFDFKNQSDRDVRSMDVWSQMNLYLNTFYPIDENFLRR